MHILLDISQSKGNQGMKFGQLTEYNKRNIFLWNFFFSVLAQSSKKVNNFSDSVAETYLNYWCYKEFIVLIILRRLHLRQFELYCNGKIFWLDGNGKLERRNRALANMNIGKIITLIALLLTAFTDHKAPQESTNKSRNYSN